MKKVFFWLFYVLFLSFFDIGLTIARTSWVMVDSRFYDFLSNFNIKNEWILEKLLLLPELLFIIISLIFAYSVSKIKVSKKSLLIPPLIIVTIKAAIFLIWAGSIMSSPEMDEMGQGGVFVFIIIYGFGSYAGMMDFIFYLGLLFNLFKRKKSKNKNDKNKSVS